MILPDKHLEVNRSLLGVGAIILQHLNRPRSVTTLWKLVNEIPEVGTFEKFSLTLAFLYAVEAIDLEDGLLRRYRR
jgi:hypothetical protein